MALIYTGIDEAGYGPMLGPLCVASATLRVEGWTPGEPAPDLWAMLESVVCKTKREAKARIAVGDSKDLKLANSSVTRHPLHHLERGVLAFLGAQRGTLPLVDHDLYQCLGARHEAHPWYSGDAIDLPLGHDAALLGIEANDLRRAMSRAGVELLDLRVRVLGETEFNTIYRTHRSKAAATGLALGELISSSRELGQGATQRRIVCDRQSGRTHYGRMLGELFGSVQVEEESARASRYCCDEHTGVLLTPGADGAYFPVALASMAAKLVRELAMMRFNRYWGERIPELKPTAGYVQDARRWLGDAHADISAAEREAMVRLA